MSYTLCMSYAGGTCSSEGCEDRATTSYTAYATMASGWPNPIPPGKPWNQPFCPTHGIEQFSWCIPYAKAEAESA